MGSPIGQVTGSNGYTAGFFTSCELFTTAGEFNPECSFHQDLCFGSQSGQTEARQVTKVIGSDMNVEIYAWRSMVQSQLLGILVQDASVASKS